MILAAIGIVLFFSVVLHEIAHGAVARALGDPTAQRAGRLTLNPLAHVDPWGTFLLPALLLWLHAPILIGWAKPVPFDPGYFRRRRSGIFAVTAAGPLTNLVLAVIMAALLREIGQEGHVVMRTVLLYGLSINLALALFNLLPIPPLDGSKMLAVLLPGPMERAYLALGRWGMLILLPLVYFGVIGHLILPLFRTLYGLLIGRV
ncbi:MAG: hypothetical protein MOGMAGMI_01120 [Candidatus Omnitrophica bacterium]|nr:hypothetical protein [Candidatus Omnitrophota bacterium]